MAAQTGKTRQPFNMAVRNAQETKKTPKLKPIVKMVRDDQPVPRPKPPAIGHVVDAQHFNQRWQQQIDASKQPDPFDAIDAKQKKLNAEFAQNAQTKKKRGLEQT